jgi:hypothetical protein
MNAPFWMKYIGLPYRLGADPESGEATDCIRLVLRVLEGAGLTPPPVERKWYNHLAKREIQPIMEDWYALTEQTAGPEDYAMTILPGEGDFAIAIVVQGGLIAVRTSSGSIWVPLESLIPLNFRRLRHA